MWDQTFKRWLDLVFWWLPKPDAAERPSAQPPEPAAASAPKPAAASAPKPAAASVPKPAAASAPKPAPASDRPDDLTVIKGIGPVVQQKLHALGIRTFDDLAAANPETLAEQLKGRQPISQALVRGWTEAADQRSAARH